MKKLLSYLLTVCMALNCIGISVGAASADETATDTTDDGVIAYAVLGSEVETKGMEVWLGSKHVEPTPTDVKGVEGWLLTPDKGVDYANIYVDVDDDICFGLRDLSNFEIEVEYYEYDHLASMTLEYNDYQDRNTVTKYMSSGKKTSLNELEIIETQDSYSWRTQKWFMPRAAMDNAVSGADFKFGLQSTFMELSRGDIIIRSIKVRKLGTRDVFDIEVKSDKFGNIFYTGDKIKFDIDLIAYKIPKNTPVNVNIQVHDENKNLWVEKDIPQVIKQSNRKQSFELDLGELDKYHYYMLSVVVKSNDGKYESRLKNEFSYVKSFKGENLNPTLGINLNAGAAPDANDTINVVKNAGFSGIREYYVQDQSFTAGYGEGSHIRGDFSPYLSKPKTIAAFAAAGLKIVDYMGTGRSKSAGYKIAGSEYYEYPSLGNQEELDRYCETYMEILRAQNAGSEGVGIEVYQVDNEIHSYRTIAGKINDPQNIREVAAVHAKLYPMIKKLYPDVKVAKNGGHGAWNEETQLGYELGLFDNLDIWAIHPYTQSTDPVSRDYNEPDSEAAYILGLRQKLDELGYEDVEFYATEWGYSSRKYECPSDVDGQLAYLPQNYMFQMQDGLFDYSVLFTLNASRMWQSGEHQFGITRVYDNSNYTYRGAYNQGWVCGAAKPAYVGMANVNYMMYDHEYVSVNKPNADTRVFRWKKTKENKDMLTFFTRAEADTINVDLGTKSVMVYDVMGNGTEVHSDSGVYNFEVTPFIKYVVGNFTKYQIVDSADIQLESHLLSAPMNKDAVAVLHNGTDKNFKLELTLNSQSTCTYKLPEVIVPGDNEIVITTGPYAITGDEDIIFTLYDEDGNIYYNEGLVIKYCSDIISVAADAYKAEGKWHLDMSLVNNSDSVISGVLSSNTREMGKLFDDMEITLSPRENRDIDLVIEKEIPKSVAYANAELAFAADTGEVASLDKRVDFTTLNYRDSELTIDADLSDWTDTGWITIADRSLFVGAANNPYSYFNGAEDISGKVSFRWDEENLYFAADITDDVRYAQNSPASQMWNLDNIQLGICYDPEGKLGSTQYEELSFGSIDGKPDMYRHYTSSTAPVDPNRLQKYDLAVVTVGNHTYYELCVPWTEILSDTYDFTTIEVGNTIDIGVQFNDNDGGTYGRKGTMIYGWGTSGQKDHKMFTKYYIEK